MMKTKGKAMLSIFADVLLRASGQKRWDAPDYFKGHRGPRGNIEIEREAAERRHRALRGIGMW
jgi:hypothetical protein